MKVKVFSTALLLSGANAFAPSFVSKSAVAQSTVTKLNLFGGKKDKKEGGGPGMMDQLAMLKKAQEIASKKMAIDKELAAMEHVGTAADGKVTIVVKYIAPAPMQQPGYEPASVKIDEEWMNSVSTEDLNSALSEAMLAGLRKATENTAEKMQVLTAELGEVMGAMGGGAPAM